MTALGRRRVFTHVLIGAALGVFLLHPAAEVIYWLESHGAEAGPAGRLFEAIVRRMVTALRPDMLPMTSLFALVGGVVGLAFGVYDRAHRRAPEADAEVERDLASVIAAGEGERAEFKASARWDHQLRRVNKDLEDAIARSIAGLFNHQGGDLLIGVGDAGEVVGLADDYGTLKRGNRDGFQQFIMGLVKTRLGGDVCPLVHVAFREVKGREVCWVTVEPADRPVYYRDGGTARYFLRAGNGTRELDVREAVEHVARRWAGRRAAAGQQGR